MAVAAGGSKSVDRISGASHLTDLTASPFQTVKLPNPFTTWTSNSTSTLALLENAPSYQHTNQPSFYIARQSCFVFRDLKTCLLTWRTFVASSRLVLT